VTAQLEVDGHLVGAPVKSRTDAEGKAAFAFDLPRAVKAEDARLTVVVDAIGTEETLTRAVAVLVPERRVEFFPEGGDLIAGVPNRVYYRATTPGGRPADIQGTVIDGQGRQVAVLQPPVPGQTEATRGLGSFTFVPEAGESYVLRLGRLVSTAVTEAGNPDERPLPAVRTGGIALHVPGGVTRPGEPVRVVLHHAGDEARTLVVTATCRGRLVAQETVLAQTGATEVELRALAGIHGVLRITVYDPRPAQLTPLAERLVYRVAEPRLALAVQAEKEQPRPGETVKLTFRSQDERGNAEPAWLLVAVVNQDALDRANDPLAGSHRAHFHFTSEVRGPWDLENADILADDNAETRAALDLILGTHGWRRFSERTASVPADEGSRVEDVAAASGLLQLDSLVEATASAAPAVAALWNGAAARDAALFAEESARVEAARRSAQAIQEYQDSTAAWVRWFDGPRLDDLAFTAPRPALAGWPGQAGDRASIVRTRPASAGVAVAVREEGPRALAAQEFVPRIATVTTPGPNPVVPEKKPGVQLLPVRQYAHQRALERTPLSADTILWNPVLPTKDGVAQVKFDLPQRGATTYRVLVQGHSATGRLGAVQSKLEVLPNGTGAR
jgi:hypothetical protein